MVVGMVGLGWAGTLQTAPTSDSQVIHEMFGDMSTDPLWPKTEMVHYDYFESPPKVQGISGLSIRFKNEQPPAQPTWIKFFFQVNRVQPYLALAWGNCEATLPVGNSWVTCKSQWYNDVTIVKDSTTWYSVYVAVQQYNPYLPGWQVGDTSGWVKHDMYVWGHMYTETPPPPLPPQDPNTTWAPADATTGEEPPIEPGGGGDGENPWKLIAQGIAAIIIILAAILILMGIFT